MTTITRFAALNLIPSFIYGWTSHCLFQLHMWPPVGTPGILTSTAITLAPIGTIITSNPVWLIPNGLITILVGAIYYKNTKQ